MNDSPADETRGEDEEASSTVGPPPGMPGWVKVFLVIGIALVLLVIITLVRGIGGSGGHGPGRHSSEQENGDSTSRSALETEAIAGNHRFKPGEIMVTAGGDVVVGLALADGPPDFVVDELNVELAGHTPPAGRHS